MIDTKTAAEWRGHELIDRDGDKIGTVGDVYLDRQTEQPEWITVKTGLFGTRETFVPIRDATSEGEIVRVPFEKAHVKDAPNIDSDQELTQEDERELYRHYGVDYGDERSGTQLPQPGGEPGQEPLGEAGGAAGAGERGPAEQGTADQTATPWVTDDAAERDRGTTTGEATEPAAPDRGTSAGEAAGREAPDRGTAAGEALDRPAPERGTDGGDAPGPDAPDRTEDDEHGAEGSPTPAEGERGVAVPGESDREQDERSAGERRVDEGATTERVTEEPVGEGQETRLRLKRYVVTEEVRVPVQREEVRVERDE